MKFSFYNVINETIPSDIIDMDGLIKSLKSREMKTHILKIRNEKDKDKQTELKKNLPVIATTGVFYKRNNKSQTEANGLACFDFDDVENPEQLKEDFKKCPYAILVFFSPRKGIKVFVRIPEYKGADEYKKIYENVREYFRKDFMEPDKTSDVSRGCFLSWDEEPYFNPDAKVFDKEIKEITSNKKKIVKKKKSFSIDKMNADFKKLYGGDYKSNYESRSEAEMALINRLVRLGYTSFDELDSIMANSNIGKWNEANSSYKKLTYEKAITNCSFANTSKISIKFQGGDSIGDLAKRIAKYIEKENSKIYYQQSSNSIVEIAEWNEKRSKGTKTVIRQVEKDRLINILDEKFVFYRINKDGEQIRRLLKKEEVSTLMVSDDFLNSLPKIERLLLIPIPFIENYKLVLPKKEWDERINSYLVKDAIEIQELELEEAKSIIDDIYSEFCFKEDVDKIIAISHIITPMCRGIFSEQTVRTPPFFYTANRERAGKDYCAGIVSILYEGNPTEYPPISTNNKFSDSSEELRKKFTSAVLGGQRLMHFANNKGKIDNAFFEQVTTAQNPRDRILGKNKEVILPNEMDFSLSANIPIRYTPDFWHRIRRIRLFYGKEDINKRQFKRTDLHRYIKENRGKIASAIYTLIKNWFDNERPNGSTFTSFPEWGNIVGGIMMHNGIGDPCVILEDDEVGGDEETKQMKEFFEYMIDNGHTGELTTKDMLDILQNDSQNIDFFCHYDLSNNGTKATLAKKIRARENTELSDIKLIVSRDNKQKKRIKYRFVYLKVPSSAKGKTTPQKFF